MELELRSGLGTSAGENWRPRSWHRSGLRLEVVRYPGASGWLKYHWFEGREVPSRNHRIYRDPFSFHCTNNIYHMKYPFNPLCLSLFCCVGPLALDRRLKPRYPPVPELGG